MHDIDSSYNQIDQNIVESQDLLGKECCCCMRILAYHFFRRDSSYRDGFRDRCQMCESSPRMSTVEHTARLREMNLSSHAVRKQRWKHQLDYMDDAARVGKQMNSSEFLLRLSKLIGTDRLYIRDGNYLNDVAVFLVAGKKRSDWDSKSFKYLWYIPLGLMPEFSIYEFDNRAVPLRERKRGWRTPLLRLIKSKLITEDQSNREFGEALGPASTVWNRELFKFRNGKEPN